MSGPNSAEPSKLPDLLGAEPPRGLTGRATTAPLSPRGRGAGAEGAKRRNHEAIVGRPLALLRGYAELVRPRILAMVLLTMAVSAMVAGPQSPAWPVLAHALAGSGVLVAGAIALNQRLEYRADAKMARTSLRPLPTGRLSPARATAFGAAASVLGVTHLALATRPEVLLLGIVSWIVYVGVYTPMKIRSPWQTPVGALAGALPTLMGGAAAGALDSPNAWTLFGVVYFWQFPHAMAIAWLCREDFAAAGLKLASVTDPSGRTAGLVSLLGSALVVPLSLIPWCAGRAGWPYALAAALLGLSYLAPAACFFARPTDRAARLLLYASLGYLPAVCAALFLGCRA